MGWLKARIARILSEHTDILMPVPVVYRALNRAMRFRLGMLYVAMITTSFFEIMVVAGIGLFVTSVNEPSTILQNHYLGIITAHMRIVNLDAVKVMVLFGGIVVVAQVVKTLMRMGTDYHIMRFAAEVDTLFGMRIMETILGLEYQDIKTRYNTAEIFAYVGWRTFFGTDYTRCVLLSAQALTVAVCLSAALVIAYPVLTLATFGLFGLMGWGIYMAVRTRLDVAICTYRDTNLQASEYAGMIYAGIREVKLAGLERQVLPSFEQRLDKLVESRTMQGLLLRLPYQTMESAGLMALVVIVCGLSIFAHQAASTTATAAVFAVASLRILATVNNVLSESTTIRISIPYIQKLLEAFSLDQTHRQPQLSAATPTMRVASALELQEVGFTYPHSAVPAIDGLSFVWPKNTSLGIIGLSGAGKSTLIDLLAGLYAPSTGRVLVDGQDIHGESRRAWMRSIGYMAQYPVFFSGTLAQNIALNFSDAPGALDEERVLRACRAAHIDFIQPERGGLHMMLAEGASNLSGGQRQRICIARALYRDPPILVMDEPTSAMDIANERLFMHTVKDLVRDRSVAIISHKLSSVEFCDNILWLDKGRARMFGPASEVLEGFRAFVAMVDAQAELSV